MNNQMEIKNENVVETYVKPSIEVIEMELEGVIAGSGGSGNLPGVGDGGNAFD